MYHLKQVIEEGLVKKRPDGKYELTSEGNLLADKTSLSNLKPRIQPKIITLIVCQNKQGEFLLYKRKRQPLISLIGFPYGKIHLGETIFQAAGRELKEKTNLSANLKHCGEVYLTTYQQGELISQILAHIFTGTNLSGDLKKDSQIGECFWEKLSTLQIDQLIPGVLDIQKLASQKGSSLFFKEYTYHI